MSAWGTVVTVGQAQSTDAPALWRRGRQVLAIWTGIENNQVFQYSGGTGGEGAIALGTIPLSVRAEFPHSQQLIQATRDVTHLLWLDAQNAEGIGGARLWSALLNINGNVERGALLLSEAQTYHFDVAPVDTQLVEAVWSEGLAAEPTLYSRRIDPLGRPRLPRKLVNDADWPSLVAAEGNRLILFWITQNTAVMMADLTDTGLNDVNAAVLIPFLDQGDYLQAFTAALDSTHWYLFWNIARASGKFETYFSSSPLASNEWTQPHPVTFSILPDALFTTGFNGGAALRITEGDRHAALATPVTGQFDVMPVAVQVDDEIGILYFEAGELAAYQPVATLETPGLIGRISLLADRDRHFDLSWAQPTQAGYANLYIATTR